MTEHQVKAWNLRTQAGALDNERRVCSSIPNNRLSEGELDYCNCLPCRLRIELAGRLRNQADALDKPVCQHVWRKDRRNVEYCTGVTCDLCGEKTCLCHVEDREKVLPLLLKEHPQAETAQEERTHRVDLGRGNIEHPQAKAARLYGEAIKAAEEAAKGTLIIGGGKTVAQVIAERGQESPLEVGMVVDWGIDERHAEIVLAEADSRAEIVLKAKGRYWSTHPMYCHNRRPAELRLHDVVRLRNDPLVYGEIVDIWPNNRVPEAQYVIAHADRRLRVNRKDVVLVARAKP